MATILQVTFLNSILIQISLKFYLTDPINNKHSIDNSIDSDNGLRPNRREAIIGNDDDPVYWCIYVSLRLDELMHRRHQRPH